MNEFTRLRLKYFFQQKWKEIKPSCFYISIIIGIFLMGFGLGSYPPGEIYSLKMTIAGGIIFGFWILRGLYYLIKAIIKWIKSNWQKATERAISELNTEKEEREYGVE